jgi:hypothetical protein
MYHHQLQSHVIISRYLEELKCPTGGEPSRGCLTNAPRVACGNKYPCRPRRHEPIATVNVHRHDSIFLVSRLNFTAHAAAISMTHGWMDQTAILQFVAHLQVVVHAPRRCSVFTSRNRVCKSLGTSAIDVGTAGYQIGDYMRKIFMLTYLKPLLGPEPLFVLCHEALFCVGSPRIWLDIYCTTQRPVYHQK